MILIPALLSSIIDAVAGGNGTANSSPADQESTSDVRFTSLLAALTNGGRSALPQPTSHASSATTTAGAIVAQFVGKTAQLSDLRQRLSDRLNALLQSGVSIAQIVSTLASRLATQVAAALGKPDAASVASLRSAFANALAPPGSGPPAAMLLDRLRRVATTTVAALNTPSGQQNRFPGNTLDAKTAGGNPAPNRQIEATASLGAPAAPVAPVVTMRSILTEALAALTGPIDSPQTAAQLQTAPQPAAPPGSDSPQAPWSSPLSAATSSSGAAAQQGLVPCSPPVGGAVAASSLDPAGPGGTTMLGRILTRAANMATNLGANPLASFSTRQAGPSGPSSPQPSRFGPPLAAEGPASAPNPTVAAFLQTFERAFADGDGERQPGADLDPAQAATPPPAASGAGANGSPPLFAASLGPIVSTQPSASSSPSDAPNAPQPAAPATDPNAVVAQLVRGLTMRDLGSSSEVRLRLVPQTLGDLNVKLTVDSTGSVTASVLAHTPEARDALLANQNQLTRSLSDAGLKLTAFDVDLSNGGMDMSGRGQSQSQNQPRYAFGVRSIAASDPTGIDPLSAIPSFAPPVSALASAGALDYLV